MRHRYSTISRSAKALALLALLSLTLPAQIRTVTIQNTALAGQGSGKVKENNGKTPDPCQQMLKADEHAEGLSRRCGVVGNSGGAARGDFNGDGIADLAVGVPYEDQNGVNAVGGVNVIYGSTSGLTATSNQFLDEGSFGFPYRSNDHFGWALASGDFNGDGFSDLAIGMPDWDMPTVRVGDGTFDSVPDVGMVFAIYGSGSGLMLSSGTDLSPKSILNSVNHLEVVGRAGASLVWANFNDDGFGDLAIGAPNANVNGFVESGEVEIMYGGSSGLQLGDNSHPRLYDTLLSGCSGGGCVSSLNAFHSGGLDLQSYAHFGSVLAAGHFRSKDGLNSQVADLVIGEPFRDFGVPPFYGTSDSGAVYIFHSFSNGLVLTATNDSSIKFTKAPEVLTQDTPGVQGAAETGDQFGRALAVGDFNGDFADDLAVGVPFEDLSNNTAANAGAVNVFFSSIFNEGLEQNTETSLFISQATLPGVGVEAYDHFGWALTAGDFDGNGKKDLAIGVPGEDVESIADAGLVTVIYNVGLSSQRTQNWTQNSSGIPGDCEAGDQFGYALSAWNYDGKGNKDLAIGVPYEDVKSGLDGTQQVDAGAVNIIYSTTGGLSSTGAQFWSQDSSNIRDVAQTSDHFGSTLY